jgi:DNA end-binding protein Ku
MLLTTLHWPDEIRSLEELNLPEDEIEIKASERKMAEQLVSSMSGEFDPSEEHDEYREALMQVIEAKIAGQKPEPARKTEPTKIGDLMAALEASVAAARESRRSGGEAEEKPAKSTAKKTAGRRKAKDSEEEAPAARRRKTA